MTTFVANTASLDTMASRLNGFENEVARFAPLAPADFDGWCGDPVIAELLYDLCGSMNNAVNQYRNQSRSMVTFLQGAAKAYANTDTAVGDAAGGGGGGREVPR